MATNSATAEALKDSGVEELATIEEYLREMKSLRRDIRKTDAEIHRLQGLTEKTLRETKAILRDIQERH